MCKVSLRPTLALGILLLVSASCDDNSNATMFPSGSTATETQVFTGTTRAVGPGTCSGDTHTFTAAEGDISVRLVSTTPAESLTVEICEPSVVDKPAGCTLGRTRIDVGQTLVRVRRGGPQQVLSLLPLTCGTDAPPSAEVISYTAAVTFRR